MTYTFLPHLDRINAALCSSGPSATGLRGFALIDMSQLASRRNQLHRWLQALPHILLFQDTFASNALDLSPALLELDALASARQQQLGALDAACQHLPVMAVLHSEMPLNKLTAHLRECLRVEADGQPYMLRVAETQMVAAGTRVLTPGQRAAFFAGIAAWWRVDHRGLLEDLAAPASFPQTHPADPWPLRLDAVQTQALLDAVAAPALASQLRQLSATFATRLDHAQQTSFACECLLEAELQVLDLDRELMEFSLQRWKQQNETAQAMP